MKMSEDTVRKYAVRLSFEEIRLPPFEDILILGKKCPYGKIGVSRSFELLIPNEFIVIDIKDGPIESVIINKRVLKKMDKDKIIGILKDKVFPYVTECEILKIDFKIKIYYDLIEGEF